MADHRHGPTWRPDRARGSLVFRAWREDDLPLALALFGDPKVTALVGGPFDEHAVRERLATELANQRDHAIAYWPILGAPGHRSGRA